MRVTDAAVLQEEAAPPAFRLRYLLVCGALWVSYSALAPRVKAAWELHSVATAFADYALCMVGPTGPSLLRDNPAEFRRLVRRRLVAAGADDRPFSRCAKGAGQVTESPAIERAHRAQAATFAEYGGPAADASDAAHLDDVAVTTRRLAELADAGWPFVRGGYTSLVQASAYAAEAAHPIELPRPGVGHGAPPARSIGRCEAGGTGGAFVLGMSEDHRHKVVRTVTPEGASVDALLTAPEARVFAASCDEHAMVVATGHEGTRDVALFSCAYLGACTPMSLPHLGASGPAVQYPLDVARVDGATVLVAPMHGIVRVSSSRDDGRSWTPLTVAFDPDAHTDLRFDVPEPDHLFVTGKRVLLYGVAPHGRGTFPVLVSEDLGASFRAP
ncbi:MAG TPA: hypothetical protein VH062_08320 [Polyangiaceae bacterium]|jgi:hypothetical protein|nr:hypothetical protein [Polyangiaceae bacterium]